MRHEIPTTNQPGEPGFFKSEAILVIAGADRSFGPGGFAVGGWSEQAEARIHHGGPKVRGPHAYVIGRPGVIDTHGGTAAEHAEARAERRFFEVGTGDELVIDGQLYRLQLDGRRYPRLARVLEAGS